MSETPYVWIRIFCAAESAPEATSIGNELINAISHSGRPEISCIEKYWKIPEFYEIVIKLTSAAPAKQLIMATLNSLGSGWTKLSETNYVWNPSSDAEFIHKAVRWVHLEYFGSP